MRLETEATAMTWDLPIHDTPIQTANLLSGIILVEHSIPTVFGVKQLHSTWLKRGA